ncbi:MAG: hypothetical protein QOD42_986 [Sphingomonadales bacterium]|nr:hypothetical protein [Sphingomonadales bacterium]
MATPRNKMSNRVARINSRYGPESGLFSQAASTSTECDGHFRTGLDTHFSLGERMNPTLPFANLAARHRGVSDGIGLSYEEAARVCLDRHHESPAIFQIRDHLSESAADAVWIAADASLQRAWANEIDATEAGACALALATVELVRGLVAVRRAETRTGADYYVNVPGAAADDLETAVRLEVSGTSDGSTIVIEGRLRQKLDQAAKGNSNLPAMAVVVGFAQLRIVSANLGTT